MCRPRSITSFRAKSSRKKRATFGIIPLCSINRNYLRMAIVELFRLASQSSIIDLCRGHGTFVQDEKLVATISGVVERVNKLISVRPLKSRCLHKPLPPHLFSLFTSSLSSSCAPAASSFGPQVHWRGGRRRRGAYQRGARFLHCIVSCRGRV